MKLEKLKKLPSKNKKRVGRGISAGQGKTSGRGTKGQNSRTGRKIRPGFEGGQMPLAQRVPKKRGFKSLNEKPIAVNVEKLNALKDGDKVTVDLLFKSKIVKNPKKAVKIVGEGKVEKKLTVLLPASKKAAEAVTKAGGKVE